MHAGLPTAVAYLIDNDLAFCAATLRSGVSLAIPPLPLDPVGADPTPDLRVRPKSNNGHCKVRRQRGLAAYRQQPEKARGDLCRWIPR